MNEIEFPIQRRKVVQYIKLRVTLGGLLIPALLFPFFGLGVAIEEWVQSIRCGLRDDHLFYESKFRLWGITFWNVKKAIPLQKITDLRMVQRILLSHFDLWALQIQTAGTGMQGPESTWYGLEDPEGVRQQVLQVIQNAYRKQGKQGE